MNSYILFRPIPGFKEVIKVQMLSMNSVYYPVLTSIITLHNSNVFLSIKPLLSVPFAAAGCSIHTADQQSQLMDKSWSAATKSYLHQSLAYESVYTDP
jgi:hypothetical protein